MDKDVKSVLGFNGYYVNKMEFKRNEEFEPKENIELPLEFNFKAEVSIPDEKDRAVIGLTCDIFDESFDNGTKPFYLSIDIKGFFQSTDIDIEDFQVHSTAILLPYLRSIVTSFTAQSGMAPIIIPPINVYNLFGNVKE